MQTIELYKEIFQNNEVRIYGTREQPLFVANDIGELLGLKTIKTSIAEYTNDMKHVVQVTDRMGRIQRTTVLTTLGLNRLLHKSSKPIALEFCKWVDQVLNTIRLTGQYNLTEEIEKERAEKTKTEQELKQALEISSALQQNIANQEAEIISLKQETAKLAAGYKPLVVYHPCDLNDFADEPCVYLLDLGNNEFKFGVSGDVQTRKLNHDAYFAKYDIAPAVVKLWKCNSMHIMKTTERKIKQFAKAHGILIKKYKLTELIKTDNIGPIVNRIDHYIEKQNVDCNASKEIAFCNAETKRLKAQAKLAAVELEIQTLRVPQIMKELDEKIPLEQIALEKQKLMSEQAIKESADKVLLAQLDLEKAKLQIEKRNSSLFIPAVLVPKTQEQIEKSEAANKLATEWIIANPPTSGEPVSDYSTKWMLAHPNSVFREQFMRLVKKQGFRTQTKNKRMRWYAND